MTNETFEEIYGAMARESRDLLVVKAREYVRNGDRLHNFHVAARMNGCTPERALKGMWDKHLVSIFDIVDDLDRGESVDLEIAREKVRDNINYLYLLWALLNERNQEAGRPEERAPGHTAVSAGLA